jgi:hypothetical protein
MGDQLSTLSAIEVEITFSTAVYYNNQPVTSTILQQIFYLKADNGTNISPNLVASSGKYWKLIFNPSFQSKVKI